MRKRKRKLTPFGRSVKKKSIDMGISLKDVAKEVGTSSEYLNLIMYGERKGYKYIKKIAEVLDIDFKGYISEEDEVLCYIRSVG